MARLELNPDRLLPADPGVRPIARELYQAVSELPILSPLSRLSAAWLAEDRQEADPTAALVTPDESVTGLLLAGGIPRAELGLGSGPLAPERSRAAFRTLCSHWDGLKGTPARLRLEATLVDVLGIDQSPSAETADDLYDAVVREGASFWEHVYPMFLARDITRHDLRELVRLGLRDSRGRYKEMLNLFGMPASDYRRFMNLLAAHGCGVGVREFREGAAAPASASEMPPVHSAP